MKFTVGRNPWGRELRSGGGPLVLLRWDSEHGEKASSRKFSEMGGNELYRGGWNGSEIIEGLAG